MAAIQQVGRLALRVEGDYWNAYFALPGTMQDAILLGSVRMGIVALPSRKAAFMSLMREAVSDLIQQQSGVRPVWPNAPVAAPESERTRDA